MTRQERKALAKVTQKQARAWPAQLTPVPESEWPSRGPRERPVFVWRSRQYLAVLYPAPSMGAVQVRRLSVNRVTTDSRGGWDQDIPWEDLQRCKREAGFGDWYAVEVYPRERDVVNVANMRHLWLLSEPLPIGWPEGQRDE